MTRGAGFIAGAFSIQPFDGFAPGGFGLPGSRSQEGTPIMARVRLHNRRLSENFSFECNGQRYTATFSTFPDGSIAEIFLSNGKTGSDADAAARDSAVVASIALQFGAPVDVIRKALLRDPRGIASSPLGTALDMLAKGVDI